MFPKILVLDDTLNNIPEIQSALQPMETEFFKANSAGEAKSLVDTHSFDLLLLSLELNGEKLISNTPTIFLAQNKTKSNIISNIKNNLKNKTQNNPSMIDAIEKPINMELLINKLKLFLEILFQKEMLRKELENRKHAEFLAKRYSQILESKIKELRLFSNLAAMNLEEPLKIIEESLKTMKEIQTGDIANTALEAAAKMRSLMNAYLNYSAIEVENKRKVSKVSLSTISKSALEEMKGRLKETQANLKIDQAAIQACPAIQGDPQQLSLVLQSIIENALKFRSEKPIEIEIAAQNMKGLCLITVCDNGKGIDPKLYEQIFWVLKPQAEVNHAGVSLAICKKIIEQMGGKIWVHSIPNQGSTLYLSLPTV